MRRRSRKSCRVQRMSILVVGWVSLSFLLSAAGMVGAQDASPRPEQPPRPQSPQVQAALPPRPDVADADVERSPDGADSFGGYGATSQRIRALAQRAAETPRYDPPSPGNKTEAIEVANRGSENSTGAVGNQAPTSSADPEQARTPLFGGRFGRAGSSEANAQAGEGDANPDRGSSSSWMLDTLGALGVVVALALLTRWVLSRLSGRVAVSGGPSVVEVLSRTAIAPRNHVILLKVGQRVIVASDSPAGMRTLAEIDDPEEVALLLAETAARTTQGVRGGFRQLMGKLNRDYDAAERHAAEGGDDAEHFVDRARDRLSALRSRIQATRISEEA